MSESIEKERGSENICTWVCQNVGLNFLSEAMDFPNAVSYTHLDVYKR